MEYMSSLTLGELLKQCEKHNISTIDIVDDRNSTEQILLIQDAFYLPRKTQDRKCMVHVNNNNSEAIAFLI